MNVLRTASTKRLATLVAAIVAVAALGTTIAIAAAGSGPVPPPKPLSDAVHDALAAPKIDGMTARIQFTNHLIDSSNFQGANPVLTGASGRLWLAPDHRVRLELQSDSGDEQVVSDGKSFWAYDATSNTVYRGDVPQQNAQADDPTGAQVPTVAKIQDALDRLTRHADVSGAIPSDVAGQPTYTVRVSPKRGGGLLGDAELAWDAARGVPLRAAIYAKGDSSPVLELSATDISYGPVATSNFDISPPSDAKVVDVSPHNASADGSADKQPVTGVDAVANALDFKLAAPDTLAGMRRNEVRLLDWKGHPAALVTYGQGSGGIAVIEQAPQKGDSNAAAGSTASAGNGRDSQLRLPTVSINGATGHELDTALGTVVRFERHGVRYTVLGSVPPHTALAAARSL